MYKTSKLWKHFIDCDSFNQHAGVFQINFISNSARVGWMKKIFRILHKSIMVSENLRLDFSSQEDLWQNIHKRVQNFPPDVPCFCLLFFRSPHLVFDCALRNLWHELIRPPCYVYLFRQTLRPDINDLTNCMLMFASCSRTTTAASDPSPAWYRTV